MKALESFDVAIVGGGISGCTTALHLARGGMRVALLERGSLCREASGVNGGTLSIQIKRASLVPYAMRSWELWRTTPEWLGAEVGFTVQGGLTLAFTPDEAHMLETRMGERKAAGAPIEFVDPRRAREIEPGLSENAVSVAYCPMDAHANPLLTGFAYRAALLGAGGAIRENAPVSGIDRDGDGFAVRVRDSVLRAGRVVLAGGVWLGRMLRWFGLDVPVACGAHMVSVTERMRPILGTVIGVAEGTLTLKQRSNGTVLIGGGWEGVGDTDHGGVGVIPANLVGNLRLAHHAIPALAEARVLRSWIGLDANVPDFVPLVGPVPGAAGAFVVGCVRGGYTIGPLIGRLLAQLILGRQPEMPLFDPARFVAEPARKRVAS